MNFEVKLISKFFRRGFLFSLLIFVSFLVDMWQQKKRKFYRLFLLHVYWNNMYPIQIFVCVRGYTFLFVSSREISGNRSWYQDMLHLLKSGNFWFTRKKRREKEIDVKSCNGIFIFYLKIMTWYGLRWYEELLWMKLSYFKEKLEVEMTHEDYLLD